MKRVWKLYLFKYVNDLGHIKWSLDASKSAKLNLFKTHFREIYKKGLGEHIDEQVYETGLASLVAGGLQRVEYRYWKRLAALRR